MIAQSLRRPLQLNLNRSGRFFLEHDVISCKWYHALNKSRLFMKPKNHQEYLKLVEEIREHDRHYYDEANPLISDYEYDQMVKALLSYEKEHPEERLLDSPSLQISEAPTEGFIQREHIAPMMSLNNTYSEEELKAFIERVYKRLEKKEVLFCCELKMDGTSLSLRYQKGKLLYAITRGNGKKGDDVTENVRTIASVPLELKGGNFPDVFEVRAEVYMSLETFHRLNELKEEAGEEPFANPRNAAAGSLKLLDPEEVAKRKLNIMAYGIADADHFVKTQEEVHALLKKASFPTAKKEDLAVCSSAEEILAFAHKIEQKRKTLPFEIDGIVVKVNSLKDYKALGFTGKAPRYAVAYKFAPEQAVTEIEDIAVQVGRSGVLTPVAHLKPVLLAGSTIARASLHNKEEVQRKDIRIGDMVVIEKAGDVIPQVVRVEMEKRKKGSLPWQMPNRCPVCNTKAIQHEDEVATRCPNIHCPAQRVRRLLYFASKQAMDIDHLGEKVAEQLVEKGLVKRISDLYMLEEKDLEKLEGFKEKSIHNLLNSIEKSKRCPFSRFIMALGIKYVGSETAEVLAQEIEDVERLFEVTEEELLEIEGIGEKSAKEIFAFFQDPEHQKEIDRFLLLGVLPEKPKKKKTDPSFAGKVFVLTGSLEKFSRSEASDLIKERGGKVSSSVSQKTDFVIVGEDPGSKYDKAKKLGIKILSEEEFAKLL